MSDEENKVASSSLQMLMSASGLSSLQPFDPEGVFASSIAQPTRWVRLWEDYVKICRQAEMTDEQIVNKFKQAMAGKAKAWRMSLEDSPLSLLGDAKHDGHYIVHQPGTQDA